MTENKPIARYVPESRSHHSIDCDTRPYMVEAENGRYMLVSDHESALAAKDARIAELDEDRKECWREFKQLRRISEKQLTDLRTAIREKAESTKLIALVAFAANDPNNPASAREEALEEIQTMAHKLEAELIAMLEEGK